MLTYQWQTSSYSGDASNCVSLALAPDGTIRLRDTKAPRTVIATSTQAVRHFIDAVIAGTLGQTGPGQTHSSI